jgi:hypothetical protein
MPTIRKIIKKCMLTTFLALFSLLIATSSQSSDTSSSHSSDGENDFDASSDPDEFLGFKENDGMSISLNYYLIKFYKLLFYLLLQ